VRESWRVPPPRDEPFDLNELDRVINQSAKERDARPWWRRWSRRPDAQAPPELLRPTRPTATRALLAVAPDAVQVEEILAAFRRSGGPAGNSPRIVLRSALPLDNELMWQPAVTGVTEHWHSFTARLLPPEVARDRLLGMRAAGDDVAALQHALAGALAAVGFEDSSGLPFTNMMVMASTFDGLSVHALHELSGALRDELSFPIDFTVRSVFAYSESADEYDLPLSAFPLGSKDET
jgi:hypothetical protein